MVDLFSSNPWISAGYKLRTHLGKSLQKRSHTIRRAVTEYNHAAAALHPPRPTLSWDTIMKYGFIDEFNILKDTRNDLSGKDWRKPAVRELLTAWHRVSRAKEELIRCEVELRRIHTAIRDENVLFNNVLGRMETDQDPWRHAVAEFVQRRKNLNGALLPRIAKVYRLSGWQPGPGVREGSAPMHAIQTEEYGEGNQLALLEVLILTL